MSTPQELSPELSPESLNIIGPEHYAKNGYPHREWAWLRKHKPVSWCEYPNTDPFWAITKHADLVQISKQPRLFLNGPRLLVFVNESGMEQSPTPPFRHLLDMDPPVHGEYRAIVSRHFTRRGVRPLQPEIERITRKVLDDVTGRGECDFVTDVSSRIPLAVIAELLGVPHQDWDQLFKWTNETIGSGDPEFQQGASAQETMDRSRLGLFQYFTEMVAERMKHPTRDITSIVANAKISGEPMPQFEMLSYYFLLVVAGNETTRNATTGGLLAFIESPGEWQKLKKNPALIDSAVEEIVRWTSPVIQFARTATEDTEIRGQKIKAGESVCLFYPSANRDEEVFEEPFKFDIARDPNPHVAFGIGEHFCLGANLARLELKVIFQQLAERLEYAELAGAVERLRSSFVGGIKHMPIRMTIKAAAAAAA
ncbi:MAG: cytochrome P450 [Candidatus Binatus sp.]|uniref:cytochrome P450 n=1 Tax=Candidatus Binatus sp. TaxID=2811406 RepID=UPI00272788A8|nr:cytochrome P450 [Candidatus Binatus sp.]MDO8432140.1 cytochrome P450 [Candidatus Binatus sp.]